MLPGGGAGDGARSPYPVGLGSEAVGKRGKAFVDFEPALFFSREAMK